MAIVVGCMVMAFMWTMILVGMVAAFGGGSKTVVANGSVLKMNLGAITDSPAGSPFDGLEVNPLTGSFAMSERMSLLKAIQTIDAAAKDDRIEGIYFNLGDGARVSFSSVEEIRAALERFKESGKFIVAYDEAWSQMAYWFASVADKIYTNPAGGMEWTGLAAQLSFYKGLLDKLDVEPVIVRHGTFKSAIEPFILDKMSPENRLQYEKMVGSLWSIVLEGVSKSRGIEVAALQLLADELAIDSPQAAVEMKMIDGLKYQDEVYEEIEGLTKFEEGENDDPKFVSFGDYAGQIVPEKITSKNKIAVIYAEGTIVSGRGQAGQVGSETMVEKLQKAAKDEEVKAVVLRINSPGGSALASEVMWREIGLLKAEKPVIVSMGDYAASGGYYIAAPADAIYANRGTLTGSIGVFMFYPNFEKTFKNKLGITHDAVVTANNALIGSTFHTPSAAELAYFQKGVEDTYATFVNHVSDGRNMSFEAVDTIGQGRVWAGADAQGIGLIDGYGGLVEAISLAAERVGVADDFRIYEVTSTPTGFEAFFSGMAAKVRSAVLRDELGTMYADYERMREMLDEEGIQARMPVNIEIR